MGDLELARLHANACLVVAERMRDRFWLASALWANEIVSRLKGDFQNAFDFNDRGLTMLPRDPRLLGTRALTEFEVGQFERGEAFLQRLLDAERGTSAAIAFEHAFAASIIPAIARITGDTRLLAVAERSGETVLSAN